MLEDVPKSYQEIYLELFKSDGVEGNTFSFDDPDQGKSTDLKISKLNKILGAGAYARWVADVDVELPNESGTKNKTHRMALKKYREEPYREELQNDNGNVGQSYKNYRLLKSKGIPTWDTYRINEEHQLVLMTLGANDNEALITANDGDDHISNKIFEENPFREVVNLDDFISQIRLIIAKLNEYTLRLHIDSWGIAFKPVGDKVGSYELRPLIADLDTVDTSDNPYYKKHYGSDIKEDWTRENFEFLGIALRKIYPGSSEEKNAFSRLVLGSLK